MKVFQWIRIINNPLAKINFTVFIIFNIDVNKLDLLYQNKIMMFYDDKTVLNLDNINWIVKVLTSFLFAFFLFLLLSITMLTISQVKDKKIKDELSMRSGLVSFILGSLSYKNSALLMRLHKLLFVYQIQVLA